MCAGFGGFSRGEEAFADEFDVFAEAAELVAWI